MFHWPPSITPHPPESELVIILQTRDSDAALKAEGWRIDTDTPDDDGLAEIATFHAGFQLAQAVAQQPEAERQVQALITRGSAAYPREVYYFLGSEKSVRKVLLHLPRTEG
jgi:hypothetical protein